MPDTTGQLDTPAMRQYRSFKEQYPDYILFFRMGDFYEMFYEDAKIASRELGLTLTSRSKGPSAVPLAGIPYHALDGYLARLSRAGYRIAICEQVEDAKQAKGLVKRDVTRLITPGTLTDESLLEQSEGNYLAAVYKPRKNASGDGGGMTGIAWAELSSGAFSIMLVDDDQMADELTRIQPAEVIVAEGSNLDIPIVRETIKQYTSAAITSRPPWAFDPHSAEMMLKEQFKTATLDGFGVTGWDASISAAGAVIEYLRETQKTSLSHLRSLRRFDRSDFMAIDSNTLRCLEVHRTLRGNKRSGSLLACIDKTRTGMGARLLERWLAYPLRSYSDIIARQDAITELIANRNILSSIGELLTETANIDRIAANIALMRVRPRELVSLGQTLRQLPKLVDVLSGMKSSLLAKLIPGLTGMEAPADLIETSIDPDCPPLLRDGGVIASGYNEELDRLRQVGSEGKSWLAQYQAAQAERLGLTTLKIGFNRVFGYYIEINNANRDKAPADYIRKQTLKNAERYITDELKQYESEVLTAGERAKSIEAKLFEEIRQKLEEYTDGFQRAAEVLANLDVLGGFAQLAIERHYCKPVITQENTLHIVDGRHPVLAEQLAEKFVPNDVEMGTTDDRLLIITGPNMAGKSTYIRQTALLVLLAQTGSFIPVTEAVIGLADRIFTRVGAADELTRGLSTFMLEMVETANILNNATSKSLVILDEVGRGTSTSDGLALAWAICEHISLRTRCKTLFATHYHELVELENLLDGTTNLNVAVREWNDEVIFLHKIAKGGTDQSYGIHVARLAGVPKEVIDRARCILPQIQAQLAGGLDMPALALRAKAAAAQLNLFADPASKVASQLKEADLNNMTPIEALDLLRKLRDELTG